MRCCGYATGISAAWDRASFSSGKNRPNAFIVTRGSTLGDSKVMENVTFLVATTNVNPPALEREVGNGANISGNSPTRSPALIHRAIPTTTPRIRAASHVKILAQ